MKTIKFEPTPKQAIALQYLFDNTITEVLFGGAAGGGKSYIGCVWIITMCLQYPGTRYLIGRSVLKTLKETTLKTLLQVLGEWQLKLDYHYWYNMTDGVLRFYNGSEILLKDLQDKPSDPDWDSLGSLEISGAFIDEAAQITEKCKNVVSSRIRYKLNEYNLQGKLLMTCNPSQGWLYTTFYKPYKDGTLPKHQQFIEATLRDNKHIPESYAQRLSQLDSKSRKRLLEGDWYYFTDSDSLLSFDIISQMFEPSIPDDKATYYISADIAGMGKDKTVIMVWADLTIVKIVTLNKSLPDDITNTINALAKEYNVFRRNIVYDSDGLGFFARSSLKGAVPFVNGSKAMYRENFQNLKTQCAYKFAEIASENKIRIQADFEQRERIIEELEQLKRDKVDSDTKQAIITKDKMKKALSRSPDFLDAILMRFYFELKQYTGEYSYSFIRV